LPNRCIDGGPFGKTFAIAVDGKIDPRFNSSAIGVFLSNVQEMSGQEINEHNTSYEGSVARPEQHERQLACPLLWPHFQEQMFVELNRQLSIVTGQGPEAGAVDVVKYGIVAVLQTA